nr:CLIP domain-containing serine protease 14D-like [Drosophila takahashii]
MALIVSDNRNCTGTLVNRNYVLTVASCIFNQNQRFVRLVNIYGGYKYYSVQEIYIHQLHKKYTNDIALLKLHEAVINIKPICIWLNEDLKLESHMTFKATDWNAIGRPTSNRINKFENRKCLNAFGKNPDQTQICAGYSNKDTCAELGSPLGIQISTNRYTLIGIQSYGALGTCVYTNIIKYIDWIVEVVLEVDVVFNKLY